MKPQILILVSALSLLSLGWAPNLGELFQPAEPQVPNGFFLVRAVDGIDLYRKDYRGGNPDFVQVINLEQGAAIIPLHGEITATRQGRGVYGGDDPRIRPMRLKSFWEWANSGPGAAFCVTNGQFFYMPENPTRLPFPLKVNGTIISDGYGLNDFPDQKLIFEIWSLHTDIKPLTRASLYNSSAPHIIAGLSADANKRAKHYTGRTFIGVDDRDADGAFEIVLIFNTKTARQIDAANVLRDFGADKVMMLDGGGSTQLLCQGEPYVYSERLIPQAIATIYGLPQEELQTSPLDTESKGLSTQSDPGHPERDKPGQRSNSTNEPAAHVDETKIETLTLNVRFQDILWIPLFMAPVILILMKIITAIRQDVYY